MTRTPVEPSVAQRQSPPPRRRPETPFGYYFAKDLAAAIDPKTITTVLLVGAFGIYLRSCDAPNRMDDYFSPSSAYARVGAVAGQRLFSDGAALSDALALSGNVLSQANGVVQVCQTEQALLQMVNTGESYESAANKAADGYVPGTSDKCTTDQIEKRTINPVFKNAYFEKKIGQVLEWIVGLTAIGWIINRFRGAFAAKDQEKKEKLDPVNCGLGNLIPPGVSSPELFVEIARVRRHAFKDAFRGVTDIQTADRIIRNSLVVLATDPGLLSRFETSHPGGHGFTSTHAEQAIDALFALGADPRQALGILNNHPQILSMTEIEIKRFFRRGSV